MWTYKQCKTMLTHVFKPRWLVLILLSAGNREFRRGWEKEKFGEEEVEEEKEEREKEGEKGRSNESVRHRERGRRQKDSQAWSARTKEGNRGNRRVRPIAERSSNVVRGACTRRRRAGVLMKHKTCHAT